MTWFLTGFATLPNVRKSFLIPLFMRGGTNYTYAQELDRKLKIAEFFLFEVSGYETLFPVPLPVPRQIGDDGILAVTTDGHNAIYGPAEKLRSKLEAEAIDPEVDPFFGIEVGAFLGRPEMVENALKAATKRFASPDQGFWLRPKSVTKVAHNSTSDSVPSTIYDLDTGVSGPQWLPRWCSAWDTAATTYEKKALIERAEQRILSPESRAMDITPILHRLIRGRQKPNWLFKVLLDWFDQRLYDHPKWPSLWLGARRLYKDVNAEFGLEYMRFVLELIGYPGVENGKRSLARGWSRVWEHLWKENYSENELIALCHSAIPIMGNNKSFVKYVMLSISSSEIVYHFSDAYLMDFLRRLDQTNLWAQVFVELKTRPRKDIYHQELTQLAKEWLRLSLLGKAWKRVWMLVADEVTEDERLELARRWLENVYPDAEEWPTVMTLILASGVATELDMHNAKQWLSSKDRNSLGADNLREALSQAGHSHL